MISGKKILLRAPLGDDQDLKFLYTLRNDIEQQSMLLTRPRANSSSKVLAWLEKCLQDEHSVFFVIAEKQSDKVCGFIQLTNIDFVNRSGCLGICIADKHRGKGFASEALQLLEDYVRNVFNMRKITLEVLSENERAISFYLKSNYERTGVWKEHVYQNGEFHSIVLMEKFL